jgi:peptide/nickel transport system ATP-binding protein
MSALLSARGVSVAYRLKRGWFGRGDPVTVRALTDIDLDIETGETVALVGESGSGKSTLGRVLIRTLTPTAGTVAFRGSDITALDRRRLRPLRRHFQIVFQDPFGSLNPRLSIGHAVAEPLIVHGLATGAELRSRVAEALDLVGIEPAWAKRRPHEFSGGQRQRICIARAIVCRPDFIVADEALSALDVTLQGQVLDLFAELKRRFNLTYLFISHDLDTVRQIADRVAVLYLGRIVELAPAAALFARPRHPYTQALLAAMPVADPVSERARIYTPLPGEPPSPANPPSGCAFHPRCPRATALCRAELPPLRSLTPGHQAACHFPD